MSTNTLSAGLAADLASRKEEARTRYRRIILSGLDDANELPEILLLLKISDEDLAADEIAADTVRKLEPQLPTLKASADAATTELGESGEAKNAAILAAQTEYQERLKEANATHEDVWRRQRQSADEYERARQAVLRARTTTPRIFGPI